MVVLDNVESWSQIESLAGLPDSAQVRAQLAGKGE